MRLKPLSTVDKARLCVCAVSKLGPKRVNGSRVTGVSLRLQVQPCGQVVAGASRSELFSPTRAVMDPDSFIVTTTKHGLDDKTATAT